MVRVSLDHCVIHVSDWERAKEFYVTVLGAEAMPFKTGYQFKWGEQQLNVHGPGLKATPVAKLPVMPGGSDICFRWHGPISGAIEHLQAHGIEIEEGPVERNGALGPGTSIYFRDPDGSLMEFMSYE
jgi:catechol 2,3-dioxygenase-like lactoylglutathione lyase family enzyme